MTGLDLRPLSLGEILDRTFSLYRRYFLLFIGIAGIPALVQLSFNLLRVFSRDLVMLKSISSVALLFLTMIVSVVMYLFSQGATILTVTDLYLGRSPAIGQSFRRVWGSFFSLLGVVILNGLAVGFATLLLVIPGIYLACRLFVCVPAALIEDRGPSESLSRSFELTRDSAGRAFVILVLYFVVAFSISSLLTWPFAIPAGLAMRSNPAGATPWLALTQVMSSIATVLVTPILLIATSLFYFDMRVRKEGFDLQFMLDPDSEGTSRSQGSIPSILS